jgi:hypothetical protein
MQEEDQSNSSPSKSISPEEEKHDFFTLSKGKKCDQSSDNIWKIELTRYLESKKTDDLTFLNQYPLIKRLFFTTMSVCLPVLLVSVSFPLEVAFLLHYERF